MEQCASQEAAERALARELHEAALAATAAASQRHEAAVAAQAVLQLTNQLRSSEAAAAEVQTALQRAQAEEEQARLGLIEAEQRLEDSGAEGMSRTFRPPFLLWWQHVSCLLDVACFASGC